MTHHKRKTRPAGNMLDNWQLMSQNRVNHLGKGLANVEHTVKRGGLNEHTSSQDILPRKR